MRLWTSLLVALLLCSCTSHRAGQGYRIVSRTVDMRGVPGAFEGVAHYSDLYYASRRLGTVGQWSISPSGRFALFEDTGKLLLFDRDLGQTREVTDGGFAIPKTFDWNEGAGTVEVAYFAGHSPSRIELRK